MAERMQGDSGQVAAPVAGGQARAVAAKRGPGRPTLSNEELLDTALDLFLAHGFERTSIDAITAAAGMAKRTVYARYGDKLSLFKAAIRRAVGQWIVPIEHLRAVETDEIEETLQRIGALLVANILSPGGIRLLRLTNAESGRIPDIGAYNVRIGTEPTLAYLADLFRRRLGTAEAPLDDAEEAALAFLHLVVGGPANNAAWGVTLEPEEVDRHRSYCVRLFLNGFLPQHRQPDPGESAPIASLLVEAQAQVEALRAKLQQAARVADGL